MQFTGGPQYCETPGVSMFGLFPVEPFNTWSNLSIVFFAIIGFVLVLRRTPKAWDLYLLCAILFVNGWGSFFWHGLRDRFALGVDVQAGLLFLAALFLLWARRVMPIGQALLFVVAFFLAVMLSDRMDIIPYGRWASMMPAVVVFGSYLIYRTSAFSRLATYVGSFGIFSALLALTFRTIDTEHLVCNAVPMGTHFLWHIFLSTAAFTGMLSMIWVIESGGKLAGPGASDPLGAAAE